MSTLSVVDESQRATLPPGFYWIEMAFDRPVAIDVLLRALRTIGFDSVGVEMEDPLPTGSRVGAMSMSSKARDLSAYAAPAPVKAAVAVPPAYAPPPPPTVKAAATVMPTAYAAPPPPEPGVDLRAPTPVMKPYVAPTSRTAAGPSLAPFLPPPRYPDTGPSHYVEPGATAPAPAGISPGSDLATGPGAGAGPSPDTEYYDDAPPGPGAAEPGGGYVPTPAEGGGGGGGGGGGEAAPHERQTLSATKPGAASYGPPVPGAVRVNPEGGAPMWLCPPGTKWRDISVGGRVIVGGEEIGSAFRFVAQLGHAIDIKSLPGLRWTILHEIAFDPWGPMSFRLTPHELVHGQLYDLRFLSRDKTAKSKKDVLQLLTIMGFRPATIFLSKRNMRIPGRPLTTLSEWFGVGLWTGPDSVVVSSDPFYFAEVKPTS